MKGEKERSFQDWEERERFVHDCLRYRGLLYQIAERVLEGPEGAKEAVNRSLAAATKTRGKKSSIGEFRGWLLRIVIEEALRIRQRRSGQGTLGGFWPGGSSEPQTLVKSG